MTREKIEEDKVESETEMLTPSEIAQLRQKGREYDAYFQKAFEDISWKNP